MDHHHLPCTSEPWHYHLSPSNALRYSGVAFRYYGHWCYQYPVMLVFHSYHDAILQKYIFELTLFYSKKKNQDRKKNKKTKTNIKDKSLSDNGLPKPTVKLYTSLWNVNAHKNKLAVFEKSKIPPLCREFYIAWLTTECN